MTAICKPRPAKQSPPNERDLRIFKLAEIHRWTHEKIAEELGDITRRRVSQIVEEVRLWLANHETDDPLLQTELERKRLARNLERMRLEDVIERTVSALNQAPPTLAVTCSTEGGPVMRYVREQPPVDVRLLKTYLRAVETLGKLTERPEIPAPPKESEPWKHPRIQEVVAAWKVDRHNYLLTDDNLSKFAEDLTVAFLDCFGRPPSPADQRDASDASQVSLWEALPEADVPAEATAANPWQEEPSSDDAAAPSAAEAADGGAEKLEKGSATAAEDEPKYAKPLLIGPFPPDHPARRNGPPILIGRASCSPDLAECVAPPTDQNEALSHISAPLIVIGNEGEVTEFQLTPQKAGVTIIVGLQPAQPTARPPGLAQHGAAVASGMLKDAD